MVITGAGDGVMGAAQGGAGRASSFGVNIRLPFEQQANETIAGDLGHGDGRVEVNDINSGTREEDRIEFVETDNLFADLSE